MEAFEYANPTTLKEAIALLSGRWGQTELLAGGTDLLSLMKDYVITPKRVVNLKGIAELYGIQETAEGLRLGALVTLEELLRHASVRRDYPSLVEAAEGVTSPQMRNMGTVGGDLLQRPRCWYFRSGYGLFALDEHGRSLVPGGDNRYHAIFANSGAACFVSPSSLAPPLITLGAKVRLVGPEEPREVPVGSLFILPRSNFEREHALFPNEVLTEVVIPAASRGLRTATYEVRQRELMDWPLVTASVALKLEGDRVSSARIVLGHVAPIPWPAAAAEKWLAGKALDAETAAAAGNAAAQGARPFNRNGYKVQLARVAVKRALLKAAGKSASAATGGA